MFQRKLRCPATTSSDSLCFIATPVANRDTFQSYADNGVDLLRVNPSSPQ